MSYTYIYGADQLDSLANCNVRFYGCKRGLFAHFVGEIYEYYSSCQVLLSNHLQQVKCWMNLSCLQYLFDSVLGIQVLPCGHTMHRQCLREMHQHGQYVLWPSKLHYIEYLLLFSTTIICSTIHMNGKHYQESTQAWPKHSGVANFCCSIISCVLHLYEFLCILYGLLWLSMNIGTCS